MKHSIKYLIVITILLMSAMVSMSQSLTGTGHLHAEGDGSAKLLVRSGNVSIKGDGKLIIVVRDSANIDINGDGHCETITRPSVEITRCWGFNGEAYVNGSGYSVILNGKNIILDAYGTGKAYLRGVGWFNVNGILGLWTPSGKEVDLVH